MHAEKSGQKQIVGETWATPIRFVPVATLEDLLQVCCLLVTHSSTSAAGACCSDLGVQHYGMADEIEFLENYKTHVASTVIMMQVRLPVRGGVPPRCMQYVHKHAL